MISATFMETSSKNYSGFTLTGHANAGEFGSDIVCSAASALSISTINGITEIGHIDGDIVINEVEGGYLSFSLPNNLDNEQQKVAQILLRSLYLGFQEMVAEYFDYVELNTTKIHGGV